METFCRNKELMDACTSLGAEQMLHCFMVEAYHEKESMVGWARGERMSEETVCPACGAAGPFQQITNGERCQQCGHQFNMMRTPVPRIERRFNGTGFVPMPEGPPPIWGNPIAARKK
jgi:DNA-directed RNA polymerase subunit RPC12/RpoP